MHFGGNDYGATIPHQAPALSPDDLVISSFKRFLNGLSGMIFLWLLSYILVMLQVIDKGRLMRWTIVMFIPMWLGSLVGLITSLYILAHICLADKKIVTKTDAVFERIKGSTDSAAYIEFESLPLLRRLIFWCIVVVVSVSLITLTQVQF